MIDTTSLDIDAVRTFVLVAELRSFTRAAEAAGSTQSAVSLRIRRLEAALGRRLVERTPRLVRLSNDGAAFLEAARGLLAAHDRAARLFEADDRRLVVGISEHVVGADLPHLLQRLHQDEPGLVVELRIDSSRNVLDAYRGGELDVAVALRHGLDHAGGETILQDAFGWLGTPDFAWNRAAPLPLATQAAPCGVRAMAITALEAAGIAWTEVFVGGGIATMGAAIGSGMAVAALARRIAPAGTLDLGPRLGLPPLPSLDVMLHAGAADPRTRASIRRLVAAIRSTANDGGTRRLPAAAG